MNRYRTQVRYTNNHQKLFDANVCKDLDISTTFSISSLNLGLIMHFKVLIHSDEVFLAILAAMAISNGYIGNISMMFGPKMIEHPEDQSRIASIMCFFLVFGVSVGALLSAPLLQLL